MYYTLAKTMESTLKNAGILSYVLSMLTIFVVNAVLNNAKY